MGNLTFSKAIEISKKEKKHISRKDWVDRYVYVKNNITYQSIQSKNNNGIRSDISVFIPKNSDINAEDWQILN